MKVSKHTNMGYALENYFDVYTDTGIWKATIKNAGGFVIVTNGYLSDSELQEAKNKL